MDTNSVEVAKPTEHIYQFIGQVCSVVLQVGHSCRVRLLGPDFIRTFVCTRDLAHRALSIRHEPVYVTADAPVNAHQQQTLINIQPMPTQDQTGVVN